MTAQEYLSWVLDYYRTEFPGITDATLYELMKQELGDDSGVVLLFADRIGADISLPPPTLASGKAADPFYLSFEWRRVRMFVLERDGARCSCCGRTTADDDIAINVDHIKPRSRYPQLALDPSNLQVLCNECNHGKGNLFTTNWRRPEMRR